MKRVSDRMGGLAEASRFMRRQFLVLGMVCLGSACGIEPNGPGGTPDFEGSDVDTEIDGNHGCDVELDAPAVVSAGTLFEVSLEGADRDKVEDFALKSDTHGVFAVSESLTSLGLRASYQEEPAVLRFEFRCRGEEIVLEHSLTMLPLVWEKIYGTLPDSNAPSARKYASVWLDADSDNLFVHGGFEFNSNTSKGDLYRLEFSSGNWLNYGAAPSVDYALSGHRHIESNGNHWFFGGLTEHPDGGAAIGGAQAVSANIFNDSWDYLSGQFDAPDSHRYQPAVFRLPGSNDVLQVGGSTIGATGLIGTSSVYHYPSGGDAIEVSVEGDIEGRDGFAWAWVPEQSRLLMFSGEVGGAGASAQVGTPAQGLVALEISEETAVRSYAWKTIDADGEVPAGRRNAGYFYDSLNFRLFIYGGAVNTLNGPGAEENGLYVLHLDEGLERWHRVNPDGEGPELGRASAFGVFDPVNNRGLTGFGNSQTAIYSDVYALQL